MLEKESLKDWLAECNRGTRGTLTSPVRFDLPYDRRIPFVLAHERDRPALQDMRIKMHPFSITVVVYYYLFQTINLLYNTQIILLPHAK